MQPPLRHPVAPGKKRALFRSTWIYVNQKQQVMETAGPVGWLWPGGSGKLPAFIYCPCLPARITSSNRKQMSSSETCGGRALPFSSSRQHI
ncbi:hypothetical protein PAMP_012074 [Pampus punctatissimus]